MFVNRVLDPAPVTTLDDHVAGGGGAGLAEARQASRDQIIDRLTASGLRGRGGAGFPTGRKWSTIAAHEAASLPTTVIVNAAEGEPGSFKDRFLLRMNPYRVVEGALIAAHTFGATDVVIAVKPSFADEIDRLRRALAEVEVAGWCDGVRIEVFEGPSHYLYGEETGLLEALDGRPPFPRVAPPWRRGIVEVELRTEADGEPAAVEMGSGTDDSAVPPALVNNVETFGHVATILAHGADWFRETGTDASPGTILCTISGSTRQHGVAEVEMGTELETVIDTLGGGPLEGRRLRAAMSGVSNPLLFEEHLATPLTHEDMDAVGSGLGAAGFIVFDDHDDLVEVIRATSRFLAVESCGQCQPCKLDGLALSELLERMVAETASPQDWERFEALAESVTEGARCFLASQQQRVVRDLGAAAVLPRPETTEPYLIAPIVDIVEGQAVLDRSQATKQPDWTHGGVDSGQSPADRLDVGAAR